MVRQPCNLKFAKLIHMKISMFMVCPWVVAKCVLAALQTTCVSAGVVGLGVVEVGLSSVKWSGYFCLR